MNAGSLRNLSRTVLPPLAVGVALVAGWELVVRAFDIQPYFSPAPSAIAEAFLGNVDQVWKATKVSGANALVGLVGGVVAGVALSFVLMLSGLLNELVAPLAVALNAIPIVVIVTIFQRLYPQTSEMPRRLVVMLVVFFIVLVNVSKGLRGASANHLDVLRSMAAGRWTVLTKLRIPNALPYLFTALKIAAPTSVITAFVAEYFGGRTNGLGSRITSSFANSNTAGAWAYVLGACGLGLAFYLVSTAVEKAINHSRGPAPGGA